MIGTLIPLTRILGETQNIDSDTSMLTLNWRAKTKSEEQEKNNYYLRNHIRNSSDCSNQNSMNPQ